MTQTMTPLTIALGGREVALTPGPSALYTYGRADGDLARLTHPTQGFSELCLVTWCLVDEAVRWHWATPIELAPLLARGDKTTMTTIGVSIAKMKESVDV